jgi:acyl transferase domain-containing protein
MMKMDKYTGLEIAVIGMAGRFPNADTIGQYWANLRDGKDCIGTFTDKEALEEGESAMTVNDPRYVRSYAYLENKQYFDAAFFNYRPEEAELMDPQTRIYHECCWEALEDSGYSAAEYKDKVAMFAAASPNANWVLHAYHKNRTGMIDDFTAYHLWEVSFMASRVSYRLNLKGPSVFLQTGCSSSLVAIHEACNSLLLGECTMALAGGVAINNYSKRGYIYKEGLILSRDGKCRAFDAESSGTVSGEGAGVVVLKRLKDAIRDRDHI